MSRSQLESSTQEMPGLDESGISVSPKKKKGFFRRYRIAIIVVVVLLVAGGAFAIYKAKTSKKSTGTTTYQYEMVKKGTFFDTISGTGNLAVRDEVAVNPTVTGTVKAIKVSEGDTVSKGDTLYVLDDTDVAATIKKAAASVTSARQQVAQAKSSLTQAREQLSSARAAKSGSSSSQQSGSSSTSVTAAKESVSAAKLGVSAAQESLSSAQSDYSDALDSQDDLRVKAPCAGTIWTINIAKGDSVGSSSGSASSSGSSSSSSQGGQTNAGTSSSSSSSGSSSDAMIIAKNGTLSVKLAVNESDITKIEVGQDTTVTLDAFDGESFAGSVDEVAREGSSSSNVVSYDVWIVLDNDDARFKSGMTASATIAVDKQDDVLTVSNAAVKGTTSSPYVLVMKTGATQPSQVSVKVGTRGDSRTIITSGLTAGEKIVTQSITLDSSGDAQSSMGAMGALSGGSSGGMQGGPGGGGGGTPPSGGPQGGN